MAVTGIEDHRDFAFAVWELTLRCNLACMHCGSRADAARASELSTDEALALVPQLVDTGIRQVTLLGGEAYLRQDWSQIAQALVGAGIRCTLTTGAWGLTARLVDRLVDAGIDHVAVSVDGLESTHDALRGRPGSWRQCFTAIDELRRRDLSVGVLTQVNRRTAAELPLLYGHLSNAGVQAWQTQLTAPMGRAADNWELLLQPPEILELHPLLAKLACRAWSEGMRFVPGPNIGYYGPYERLLRGNGHPWGFWRGPAEGLRVLGIESDGTVKADPTLPTDAYAAGNVRHQTLREIVETSERMRFNLHADAVDWEQRLWGFCSSCQHGRLCRGGDTFTAHVFFGRPGNHPYCYHRAATLQSLGRRERLVRTGTPTGQPYDHTEFALVEEPADLLWPDGSCPPDSLSNVQWPDDWPEQDLPQWPELDDERWPLLLRAPASGDHALPRPAYGDDLPFFVDVLRAKRSLDEAEAELRQNPSRPEDPSDVQVSSSRLPATPAQRP